MLVLKIQHSAPNSKGREVTMEQLLYKPLQCQDILNLGRSKIYELIATKQLRAVRCGRAIRIPAAALREYVAAQEAATAGPQSKS
jgi:excisionase family DNA binding protein